MNVAETTSESFAALADRAARRRAEVEALADELNALAGEPVAEPTRVIMPSLPTVDDVASSLSLSRSAVYELMRAGRLGLVQIGARRRAPVAAGNAYVAQITGTPAARRLGNVGVGRDREPAYLGARGHDAARRGPGTLPGPGLDTWQPLRRADRIRSLHNDTRPLDPSRGTAGGLPEPGRDRRRPHPGRGRPRIPLET